MSYFLSHFQALTPRYAHLRMWALLFTGAMVTLEVAEELYDGEALSEALSDGALVGGTYLFLFFGFLLLSKRIHRIQTVAKNHQPDLAASMKEKKVESSFAKWQLSKSESFVARKILDGLSIAEIAAQRFTSEKTVRNQASAIYQKSGLAGRAAFSAFFLKEGGEEE